MTIEHEYVIILIFSGLSLAMSDPDNFLPSQSEPLPFTVNKDAVSKNPADAWSLGITLLCLLFVLLLGLAVRKLYERALRKRRVLDGIVYPDSLGQFLAERLANSSHATPQPPGSNVSEEDQARQYREEARGHQRTPHATSSNLPEMSMSANFPARPHSPGSTASEEAELHQIQEAARTNSQSVGSDDPRAAPLTLQEV
ncbi:hypothetical protein A1O1_07625 [Capronia coronata CBS 617.96]|uniref:Uncharacterized protein n=1 Tax=Capronia coronata CBS 617.96 TaxID=1182541 RepID=W9XX56_9EURO|nr:uncharacterized protein A1O1_07625 [Capronia coronata CBS 617.96]EXJ81561.1 hypothetical protein A1O1_07625 [Capronia coronata CBS 617.96]